MKKIIWLLMAIIIVSNALAYTPEGGIGKYNFTDSSSPIEDLWAVGGLARYSGTYTVEANYPTFNFTGNGSPTSFKAGGANELVNTTQDGDAFTAFTVSFWMNATALSGEKHMWGRAEDDGCGTQRIYMDGTTLKGGVACGTVSESPSGLTAGLWYHVVYIANETGTNKLYLNGELIDSDAGVEFNNPDVAWYFGGRSSGEIFTGYLDELQYFDMELTADEVNNLYNCNNHTVCSLPAGENDLIETYGLTFQETAISTLWLNVSAPEINISALNNATLHWNNTDYVAVIANQTQGFIAFNVSISTPLIDANNSLFWFNWTYNLSLSDEFVINETSPRNQTGVFAYLVTNSTIKTNLTETEVASWKFNLLKLNGTIPVINYTFYWNNSLLFYNSSGVLNGFNASFVVPYIPDTATTVLLNGSINFTISYNGKTVTRSSAQKTINVSSVTITNCSLASNPTIIFLLKNESSITQQINGSMDITFVSWATTKAYNKTLTKSLTGKDAYGICFNTGSGTFYTESTQVYSASGYAQRTYFLLNRSFDYADKTNITLFLLDNGLSSNVIVTVVDENNDPLSGHYVETLRYYPAEDLLRTVEISRTDTANGEALTHLKANDVFYQFIIKDENGIVLKVTNPAQILQSELTIQVLLIEEFVETLEKIQAITHTLVYDNETGIGTFFFSDSNNVVQSGTIEGVVNTPRGEERVCYSSITSASGTLYCDTGNTTGDLTLKGYITKFNGDSILLQTTTSFLPVVVMGATGLILWIILGMVLMNMGLFNPIASIAFGIVALIGGIMMGLISFSYQIILLFVVVAGIMIVRMRT